MMKSAIAPLVLVALLHVVSGVEPNNSENELVSTTRDNFLIIDTLSDGEVERRVRYNGVTAKETAVSLRPDGETEGLKVWEVAQGKKFIQLIYDNSGKLVDCDYAKDPDATKEFTDKFVSEADTYLDKFHTKSSEGRNITVHILKRASDLDPSIRNIVDYRRLRRTCKKLHKSVRKAMEIASNKTRQDEESDRVRRDALMLMRVPGTQWCGVGSRTTNENELGGFQGADKCCRSHDLDCPFYINTLTENYGLYNWRAYTMNHCDCDERFRTCLKMANTAASNMVGKIFFNIIQTKCFVLKPEKVCTKRRNWWGNCLKTTWEKKAHIRDPLRY